MTNRNFAASRLINPLGSSPVLTEAQVWAGLGIKARNPQSFVAAITSCEVISDDGHKIVRSVSFGGTNPVTEEIELHEGTIAYFEMSSTGVRITNIVSYNFDGDLVLTFSFANGIPGFSPEQPLPDVEALNKAIGGGVEHTIKRLRELAQEGTI
ncbi:hypothetical protein BDZ94DRAFT_1169656 [Collybia nuda]|uniref:DUF1857 family protein n=1 Tax=Collybia nuda TaxID=64659 RepID=A0A9P5Y3F2_9AGAR|nr:hypothetical protein BDZ94DRAFT_1169656 [Collybia nuda]